MPYSGNSRVQRTESGALLSATTTAPVVHIKVTGVAAAAILCEVRENGNVADMPLNRGPLIGAAYCGAGVGVGFVARRFSGRPAQLLWVVAALLAAAGLWTAAFTGGLLLLLGRAGISSTGEAEEGAQ